MEWSRKALPRSLHDTPLSAKVDAKFADKRQSLVAIVRLQTQATEFVVSNNFCRTHMLYNILVTESL
jgi:hypothetical protein